MKKRLRLGMIGGGQGAFIGAVHRLSARMDDKYEFVAGCLSSTPKKAELSAKELGLDLTRSYPDYKTMAEQESQRDDGVEGIAPTTSSILSFKSKPVPKKTMIPPIAPIIIARNGDGAKGSAVIATNPPSAPFNIMITSVFPVTNLDTAAQAITPAHAAKLVLMKIKSL